MRVTADCDLIALLNVKLHHGWLLLHQLHDGYDYLEDILPRQLFAILEPLNHILDELQCHFLLQLRSIVRRIHHHVFQI